MNKLTNLIGAIGLSLASLVGGCSIKENITPLARADFDKDGIEDIVCYVEQGRSDHDFWKDPYIYGLALVNGKDVINDGKNLYIQGDKFVMIEPNAKVYGQQNIANLSVQDVNNDGFPDISYTKTIGNKKHKVYFNQGDGTLKGQM